MGKVYRAEQAPLGRVCAVKVLNPSYAGDQDPEFHKRFFLEASIASKLTHPNTVTIFDYGKTEDDIYFMAMEYLEGLTLHRAIKMCGTLPEARVLHIAAQICRALREAHGLGVIHRDLKPANIFLVEHGDEEDFVKVLDFGLVKEMDPKAGDEQLTQTGLFMGSPKYMAPEQIRGEHVDARTDIYSLGVMLYEMLTGKAPFERNTSVNTLMAHVNDAPPPLRTTNPNITVSQPLEDLVMRCLEKEAERRFSSMDELLVALKQVSGAPASVFPGATGSYGAFRSGGSGAFPVAPPTPTPLRSVPPAPVLTNPPTAGEEMPDFRRKKSRSWAFALVAVGAIVGVAARVTLKQPTEATSNASPTPAVTDVSPTTPAVTSTETHASSPASAALRVESDPAGATVREDGKDVCAATPCTLTYRGDDAAKVHHLVVAKAGFKSESRDAHASEAPLAVKLARASGGFQPHAVPDKVEKTPEKTPDGFKEMPY